MIIDRTTSRQEELSRLGKMALASRDVGALLDDTVRTVAGVLGAEFCRVLQVDGDAESLLVRSGVGWPGEARDLSLAGSGAASQARFTLASDIPVKAVDLACETRFGESLLLREHAICSSVSVIIPGMDRPWGVLDVHSRQPDWFSDEDAGFVQAVSLVLAGALAREASEKTLRKSEALLRGALRSSPGSFSITDREGRYVMANATEAELFGLSSDDLIGRKYRDVHNPSGATFWDAIEREVTQSRRPTGLRETVVDATGRTILFNQSPVVDPGTDEVSHYVTIAFDVTAWRETERLFRAVIDSVPLARSVKDHDGRYVVANKFYCDAIRQEREHIVGRTMAEILPESVAGHFGKLDRDVIATGTAAGFSDVAPDVTVDASRKWITGKWPLSDPGTHRTSHVVTISIDVTEVYDAHQKAEELGRQLEAVTSRAPVLLTRYVTLPDGSAEVPFLFGAMAQTLGFDREAGGQSEWGSWNHTHPDDQAATMERWIESFRERAPYDLEYRYITTDGRTVWLRSLGEHQVRDDGAIVSDEVVIEITRMKDVEAALREQRELLQSVIDAVPAAINVKDRDKRIVFANKTLADYYGTTPEKLEDTEYFERIEDPEERTRAAEMDEPVFLSGEVSDIREQVFVRPDGTRQVWIGKKSPILGPEGNVEKVVTVALDISDRVAAEARAAEAGTLLGTVAESMPGAVLTWSIEPGETICQRFAAGQLVSQGLLGSVVGSARLAELWPSLAPDSQKRLHRALHRAGHRTSLDIEVQSRHGGEELWFRVSGRLRAQKAMAPTWDLVVLDTTKAHRGEAQLRLAQKMDSLGNLTGGIAHDFNNVLAVIMGNLELLQDEVEAAGNARECVDAAYAAAESGAQLTSRLLAFARRQPVQEVFVDVGPRIESLARLMRRTLSPQINLQLNLQADTLPVLCDPDLFDSALMNLVVNASDAMEARGQLTIEARNIDFSEDEVAATHVMAPGAYVEIAVTDTGCGMSPEIIQRAFEPLFTTKQEGKGTGFGLPMVYSFVRQAGGRVALYSEVGQGTTVRVYLPRATSVDMSASVDPASVISTQSVQPGHALVVDDNEGIRRMVATQLRRAGLEVSEASNAQAAFEFFTNEGASDLLVSDVVMPGEINGVDLAQMVRERWPDTKIILISGYPQEPLKERQAKLRDFEILSKPFRAQDLVRRALELLRKPEAT